MTKNTETLNLEFPKQTVERILKYSVALDLTVEEFVRRGIDRYVEILQLPDCILSPAHHLWSVFIESLAKRVCDSKTDEVVFCSGKGVFREARKLLQKYVDTDEQISVGHTLAYLERNGCVCDCSILNHKDFSKN